MTEGMEQWDLTSNISPYLDRHMMFPLLEFLDGLIKAGTINYNSKDVAAARLALLKPTHMVDYAIDIYKSLEGGNSVPKEMDEQKAATLKTLEELEQGCKGLHELNSNTEEKVRIEGSLVSNSSYRSTRILTPFHSFIFSCYRFRPS
jgi:translation initiation factor 3 subunit E